MSHPNPTHDRENEYPEDRINVSLPEGYGFADRAMNIVAGGDFDLFSVLTGKPHPSDPRAPKKAPTFNV